jgi:glycosyltransferase involved in cell wall biosynthesis
MPTLSVCMIVKDEEEVLERCLESIQGLWDELIIADTGSTDKTKEIAAKFNAKIFDFKNTGKYFNFSAARNFSFNQSKSDYIMWLDADDVIDKHRIPEIKRYIVDNPNIDMFTMPYYYARDNQGNPIVIVPRERILKNDKRFRWTDPIHEFIPLQGNVKNLDIPVHHLRTEKGIKNDLNRNILLLENFISENPENSRCVYYLAKEYHDSGQSDKATPLFKKFVKMPGTWFPDKANALRIMARYCMNSKDNEKMFSYIFESVEIQPQCAESYTFLGEYYFNKKEWHKAIHWYKIAASLEIPKDVNAIPSHYTWLPHLQLCVAYNGLGDVKKAYEHNEIARKYAPNNESVLINKRIFDQHINAEQKSDFGWIFTPDDNFGPIRIRCINVLKYLESNGIGIKRISFNDIDKYKVVIIRDFSKDILDKIQEWHKSGKIVIFDLCEDLYQFQYVKEIISSCDMVVTCSHMLLFKTKEYNKNSYLIEDAVETSQELCKKSYATDKIKVAYCGMGGGSVEARKLSSIIEKLGMQLVIISEWTDANIKWDKNTWCHELLKCDIVIAPKNYQLQPCKSNVQITQAMALGLPVICSPLDAYKRVIQYGKNGFIAETDEEWEQCLEKLKDEKLREEIGRNGYKTVWEKYSIKCMGEKWKELLNKMPKSNDKTLIDLIMPVYNGLEYTKACIESIQKNTENFRLIAVNGGSTESGVKEYLDSVAASDSRIVVKHLDKRSSFAKSCNVGLAMADAQYIAILNSDLIMSKNWLQPLIDEASKENVGLVGPLSNCDFGWLHNINLECVGVKLIPNMYMNQISPIIKDLYEYKYDSPEPKERTRQWIAFWCVIGRKQVFDKVGFLDDNFINNAEDVDYCNRLRKVGYEIRQRYDSFVFHFGGKIRQISEKQDYKQHHTDNDFSSLYLNEKYSAPLIVIYTGPAWERWSPDSINTTGIGGSETCVVYAAKELKKLGYRVKVFNDCEGMEKDYDGVSYIDYRKFEKFALMNHIDIFISSRLAHPFDFRINSTQNLCWIHDIWLNHDPKYDVRLNKVDKYMVLSPWHHDFFANHHSVPKEKLWITPDGIDLSRFDLSIARNMRKLVYSSSPDRGLDTLLYLFRILKQQLPNLELHVYYGFNNWNAAINQRGNEAEKKWRDQIMEDMKQEGVFDHGRIGQQQLADELCSAGLWLYSSRFTETFAISAVEMQAAGIPIICTDLAALHTTVGSNGVLIQGDAYDAKVREKFIKEAMEMLTDSEKWNKYSNLGRQNASNYSWDKVILRWKEELFKVKI